MRLQHLALYELFTLFHSEVQVLKVALTPFAPKAMQITAHSTIGTHTCGSTL